MKTHIAILMLLFLNSCWNFVDSEQKQELGNRIEQNLNEMAQCEYIKDYKSRGNSIVDTIRIGKRLIDPIDDFINFEEVNFGFVKRENKIYKKSKTHIRCNEELVDVEYYQEFTTRIDLTSYKKYDDRFFTTKGRVNFWWVNSNGHLIIPINNADPQTFKPFENICGGIDKNGIYYGCPVYGVHQLKIPIKSEFEFVAKENNYWNSPNHYLVVGNKVYDVKYKLEKGYFCEHNKSVSVNKILNLKK